MLRIRLLRLLVPALLVPFAALVFWQIRSRPAVRTAPVAERPLSGARVERVEFTELLGGARRLSVKARAGQVDERGLYRLEGIDPIEVEREGSPPLVLRAERGAVEGRPGRRKVLLEGGVELDDRASGVRLAIPALEIDEGAGQARSLGAVRVRTWGWEGRANSIVYGLRGAPAELFGLEIEAAEGGRLEASRAVVRDGGRDVELSGAVRGERPPAAFTAESVRLFRPDGGRLRRAVAKGAVRGSVRRGADPEVHVRASAVELEWDGQGDLWRVALEEGVALERGGSRLSSDRLEAHVGPGGNGWAVETDGGVRLDGLWAGSEAILVAERLRARLNPAERLERAEALGSVKFEGPAGSGEAVRALFEVDAAGRIAATLEGEGPARARWARERMRISADRIAGDSAGENMQADGGVAASLLPEAGPGARRPSGLFSANEAIHFVAAELDVAGSGRLLSFTGEVRAWQGDRNLSADHVRIDRGADTLEARGSVRVRVPRPGRDPGGESGFLEVSAERLDYAGGRSRAVFEGAVRSRQAEGWVEAARMEVDFEEGGGSALRDVRADGEVRFEFRVRSGSGKPALVTGEADRLVYEPASGVVHLLGDREPASVRRAGQAGGTVTGRRLRYVLRDGSLDVHSGDADRARVRGSGAEPRR